MRKETLLELVEKWEERAKDNNVRDGSDEAIPHNRFLDGIEAGHNRCITDLRKLIEVLG